MAAHAHKFAVDPTPAQASTLESRCGAACFATNDMLSVVKANLGRRDTERSYGIGKDELTPAQCWSLAKLRKTWNQHKPLVAHVVGGHQQGGLQLRVGRTGPRSAGLLPNPTASPPIC